MVCVADERGTQLLVKIFSDKFGLGKEVLHQQNWEYILYWMSSLVVQIFYAWYSKNEAPDFIVV
jgi:hypothetical protein